MLCFLLCFWSSQPWPQQRHGGLPVPDARCSTDTDRSVRVRQGRCDRRATHRHGPCVIYVRCAVYVQQGVRTAVLAAKEAGGVTVAVHAQEEARVAERCRVARRPALLAAGDADAVRVRRRAAALVGRRHVCTELTAVAGDARRLPQASTLCSSSAFHGRSASTRHHRPLAPDGTRKQGAGEGWSLGRTNALVIGADLAGRAAAACAAAFRAWAVRATEQAGVVPVAVHAECEARVAHWLLVARRAALLAAGDADAVAVWRRAATCLLYTSPSPRD